MTPAAKRRFCNIANPFLSWKKNFFSQFTLFWYWAEGSNGITSNSWSYHDAQKPTPWVTTNLYYKKIPNVIDLDTSLQVNHCPESNNLPFHCQILALTFQLPFKDHLWQNHAWHPRQPHLHSLLPTPEEKSKFPDALQGNNYTFQHSLQTPLSFVPLTLFKTSHYPLFAFVLKHMSIIKDEYGDDYKDMEKSAALTASRHLGL